MHAVVAGRRAERCMLGGRWAQKGSQRVRHALAQRQRQPHDHAQRQRRRQQQQRRRQGQRPRAMVRLHPTLARPHAQHALVLVVPVAAGAARGVSGAMGGAQGKAEGGGEAAAAMQIGVTVRHRVADAAGAPWAVRPPRPPRSSRSPRPAPRARRRCRDAPARSPPVQSAPVGARGWTSRPPPPPRVTRGLGTSCLAPRPRPRPPPRRSSAPLQEPRRPRRLSDGESARSSSSGGSSAGSGPEASAAPPAARTTLRGTGHHSAAPAARVMHSPHVRLYKSSGCRSSAPPRPLAKRQQPELGSPLATAGGDGRRLSRSATPPATPHATPHATPPVRSRCSEWEHALRPQTRSTYPARAQAAQAQLARRAGDAEGAGVCGPEAVRLSRNDAWETCKEIRRRPSTDRVGQKTCHAEDESSGWRPRKRGTSELRGLRLAPGLSPNTEDADVILRSSLREPRERPPTARRWSDSREPVARPAPPASASPRVCAPKIPHPASSPRCDHQGVSPRSDHSGVSPRSDHPGVSPRGDHQGVSPRSDHQGNSPRSDYQCVSPRSNHPGVSPRGSRDARVESARRPLVTKSEEELLQSTSKVSKATVFRRHINSTSSKSTGRKNHGNNPVKIRQVEELRELKRVDSSTQTNEETVHSGWGDSLDDTDGQTPVLKPCPDSSENIQVHVQIDEVEIDVFSKSPRRHDHKPIRTGVELLNSQKFRALRASSSDSTQASRRSEREGGGSRRAAAPSGPRQPEREPREGEGEGDGPEAAGAGAGPPRRARSAQRCRPRRPSGSHVSALAREFEHSIALRQAAANLQPEQSHAPDEGGDAGPRQTQGHGRRASAPKVDSPFLRAELPCKGARSAPCRRSAGEPHQGPPEPSRVRVRVCGRRPGCAPGAHGGSGGGGGDGGGGGGGGDAGSAGDDTWQEPPLPPVPCDPPPAKTSCARHDTPRGGGACADAGAGPAAGKSRSAALPSSAPRSSSPQRAPSDPRHDKRRPAPAPAPAPAHDACWLEHEESQSRHNPRLSWIPTIWRQTMSLGGDGFDGRRSTGMQKQS